MTIKKEKKELSVMVVASILTPVLVWFLISINWYRKESEVTREFLSENIVYKLRVYDRFSLMHTYYLPISNANCHNIDSVNRLADDLILRIKEAKKCDKNFWE